MKKALVLSIALATLPLMIASAANSFQLPMVKSGGHLPIIRVEALKHKMRSAAFLKTKLEKKGVKVEDVRREGQVYLFRVDSDGTKAIVAIDGYSSEIIGVNVLTYAAGVAERATNSAGVHFVDFAYEFGYVVEEATFSSYTEISSEELTTTEEYSEVSYEESEEVSYEDISYDEGSTEEDVADLDQGDAGDEAGDTEADIQDDADEPADEGSSDDGGDE